MSIKNNTAASRGDATESQPSTKDGVSICKHCGDELITVLHSRADGTTCRINDETSHWPDDPSGTLTWIP